MFSSTLKHTGNCSPLNGKKTSARKDKFCLGKYKGKVNTGNVFRL